jgi:aminoglycoside phosphotransferase (APT) family kinase protein
MAGGPEQESTAQPGEASDAPDGIERATLDPWLEANVPGARAPFEFDRIAGGRSNLTFRVGDAAGSEWILRRPPLGKALGSAHDMSREHRIITGLHGTPVPVPEPIAFCDDHAVTGSDFYVMELVDGLVLRDEDLVAEHFPEQEGRRRIGEAVVDTLVDLHAVDPDGAGLGELGRREGYAERQLKRWMKQWEQSKTRELESMEETHRLLSSRIPEQQGVSLIHGDYRLDNLIVTPDGEIAAVVDWELCTLGDPLADVGLLAVYWAQPDDQVVPLTRAPTVAPGFPTRQELIDRYAERSGRDLSQLDFFVALGYWKLAAILEGVFARYSAGAYGQTSDDFQSFAKIVEQLADAGLAAARRLG